MSTATAPQRAPGRAFHRPILVAILALIFGLIAVLTLIVGILFALGGALIGGLLFGALGAGLGALIGIVIIAVGGIMLVCALGLWRMKSWAWWLSVIVAVLAILGSGLFGKIGYGLLLVYLIVVRKHFNQ